MNDESLLNLDIGIGIIAFRRDNSILDGFADVGHLGWVSHKPVDQDDNVRRNCSCDSL